MPYNVSVTIRHDSEAGVFYVADSSIPGLKAKAEKLDELFRQVDEQVPALIEDTAEAA